MKILTFGLGAFGFAINKLIGENNLDKKFYAYELNTEIFNSVNETREHPYFFKGYSLPDNILLLSNYEEIIGDVDLLIIAIPAQFVGGVFESLKGKLKEGVTILNLAKGIDIKSNNTVSSLFKDSFGEYEYNYAVLSGGMIASEVVKGKQLGADLGIKNINKGEEIKKIFENKNFDIEIRTDLINIELYGSLKNIMAMEVGYREGKGDGASTVGYFLLKFYQEMKDIIKLYGGSSSIDFSYYSLGGDIVATCFGGSRNKYFGKLVGEGLSVNEVLEKLKNEKKHAEGYETLKAVYEKVKDEKGYQLTKGLYSKFILGKK